MPEPLFQGTNFRVELDAARDGSRVFAFLDPGSAMFLEVYDEVVALAVAKQIEEVDQDGTTDERTGHLLFWSGAPSFKTDGPSGAAIFAGSFEWQRGWNKGWQYAFALGAVAAYADTQEEGETDCPFPQFHGAQEAFADGYEANIPAPNHDKED